MDSADTRTLTVRRERRRLGFGLFATQVGIILLVGVVAVGIAVFAQIEQIRRGASEDLLVLARSIATVPVVIDGLTSDDPTASIQPVADALQQAGGLEYITVVDMNDLRVAHPDPDLIGEPVSSDHAPVRAGNEFAGTEEGPMGLTLRSKVPVRDASGDVVGSVSVGVLQSSVDAEVLRRVAQVALPAVLAILIGVAIAWRVTAGLRRRLYGVYPDEMLALVQSHQAMTDGVRDGIVGLGADGRIAVINAEAQRLLSVDGALVGASAAEVLPPSALRLVGTTRVTTQLNLAGRTLIVSVSPVMADGKPAGSMVVLQDRSELDSMLAELELQRARTDVLRVESHDFDNRMHVVAGLLGLGDLDAAREYLASLPSPQRPGADAEWAPVGSPLVAALLASRKAQAMSRGVALCLTEDSYVASDFQCGPEEVTILGNLMSNAIEAASQQVDLFILGDRDGLELIIDDDGAGIPQDRAETLFARGETSKTDEAWRHGIGLDVVHAHVTQRKGTISVDRSPLGGARISVTLPRAHAHDEAGASPA